LIAVDNSSLVAFSAGASGDDVDRIVDALARAELIIPPPTLAEFASYPHRTPEELAAVAAAPLMTLEDGYWLRAGANRRLILSKGLKARLADTLVAQCCIDAGVPLIARDGDYRHFAQWCGLMLA
jgi:predicted nucleic acid-binding protein